MALFFKNKCTIPKPQITFYSAVFTQHSMKPNSAKVQALKDLPAPINQKRYNDF